MILEDKNIELILENAPRQITSNLYKIEGLAYIETKGEIPSVPYKSWHCDFAKQVFGLALGGLLMGAGAYAGTRAMEYAFDHCTEIPVLVEQIAQR